MQKYIYIKSVKKFIKIDIFLEGYLCLGILGRHSGLKEGEIVILNGTEDLLMYQVCNLNYKNNNDFTAYLLFSNATDKHLLPELPEFPESIKKKKIRIIRQSGHHKRT